MTPHQTSPQTQKEIQFFLDNGLILYEYNMTDQQLILFHQIFTNYYKSHSWEKSLELSNGQFYHLK